MLKRFVLYPFLFILFVILNPLTSNLDQINPALALRPLIVLVLATAAALLLLWAIFRDWHYAGYLLFLILVFFFTYGHVNNIITKAIPACGQACHLFILVILLMVVSLLGWRRTWQKWGGQEQVGPFLNLVLIIAVLSQSLVGLREMAKRTPNPERQAGVEIHLPATGNPTALDCSISPDIYWIVVDGYGRADVLKELYGVDTGSFLAFLEQEGFYIADQSHANYVQTVYSIPSALNFQYPKPKPVNVSGYTYFTELIAKNQLISLLRQCGYRLATFDTGFYFTNDKESDLYFSYGTELNEFEELLLSSTPLPLLIEQLDLEPAEGSYAAHRARVRYTFDKLADLPGVPGPKFVFAHIISPHPPFVFDSQGNPVEPNHSYVIADGNDFPGSWEEYRKGYGDQVQYVNKLLEKTVSALINRSSKPPVIILQGDHGPGGSLDWGSPDRSCLWERTSILNAYYLPEGGSQKLYPSISPVNSFRVVLDAYFQAKLELLPSKTYFTSHELEDQFIDISDRLDSRANCP